MTRTSFLAYPDDARRLVLPLAIAFVVLDLAALALLGPVSPADTAGDVAQLYGADATRVLISRVLHCLGLSVVMLFLGVLAGRLRDRDSATGTWTRVFFGGLVALVPIEVVRNVMFAALALRYDDVGSAALPLHVIAVILGPSIAVPITASLAALAVLMRSRVIALVAAAWLVSIVRVATLSTVVWYGGFIVFVGLIGVVVFLAVRLSRPEPTALLEEA